MKDVKASNREWRGRMVRNGHDLSRRTVNCLLNMSGWNWKITGPFRPVEPAPIAALGREHIATFYQVGKKTMAEIEAWLASFGEELKP